MQGLSLVVCVLAVVWLGPAAVNGVPEPYSDKCMVNEPSMYNASHAMDVKWYTVNLDAPPEERWKHIVVEYKEDIKELIGVIKNLSFPFFHGKLVQWIDKHLGKWDKRLPEPYADELQGIANATGMELGEIVLYNVFYEIFTVCTSIVAQDMNGKIYHARNLDFGLFLGWNPDTHKWAISEKLRKMIINVDWQKGGKTVFKSNNFAGFVGIYNGLKQGAFTLTANERFNIDGGYVGLILWLLRLSSAKWMSFHAREVMENARTYDEAMLSLRTEPLMSPVYYIVGGTRPGEGAIVTRSRERTVLMTTIADTTNKWFVLETNYDLNQATLFLDDRRTPGNACMNRLGQDRVGLEGIYQVLSSKTNLNKLTTYTVLMQVDSGRFETHIQDCTDPCYAF